MIAIYASSKTRRIFKCSGSGQKRSLSLPCPHPSIPPPPSQSGWYGAQDPSCRKLLQFSTMTLSSHLLMILLRKYLHHISTFYLTGKFLWTCECPYCISVHTHTRSHTCMHIHIHIHTYIHTELSLADNYLATLPSTINGLTAPTPLFIM